MQYIVFSLRSNRRDTTIRRKTSAPGQADRVYAQALNRIGTHLLTEPWNTTTATANQHDGLH